MIHIYDAENAPLSRTDYSMNGDCILEPSEAVYDTNTKTFTLEHPIDEDGRYKHIMESAVIKAPCYNGTQLFRIYDTEKTETAITAEARPIFYDAKASFLFDNRPTSKNGQQALDWILSGTRYQGKSDIQKVTTAYYENKNVIEALLSDDEQSFLNRWGGEVEFDNFTIIINQRNGEDKNAGVYYGQNITSIKETINTDDVIYNIRPQSYNGYTLPNNELISQPKNFPRIGKTVVKKYDDIKLKADLYDGEDITYITVCDTMDDLYNALRKRANEEFNEKINEAKTTIKINMVGLRNCPEYKNYTDLENISLGDTVTLYHPIFDDITARVNSLKYDALAENISQLVIGNAEYNYIKDTAVKQQKIYTVIDNSTGNVTASKVSSSNYTTTDSEGREVSGISGSGYGVKYLSFENGLITGFQEGTSSISNVIWGHEEPEDALADKDNGTVYIKV